MAHGGAPERDSPGESGAELIRTTLYVVSPALAAPGEARSKLYSASHHHLFRGGAEVGATMF